METNLGQGVPVKRWRKCWGEALKFCSWPHYLWRIIACSSVEKKLGALARWEVGQTRAVPTSCRVRNWWKNVVWPAGLECPLLYLLNAPSPQNRWITVKSCVLQTDFDFHSEWENTFYVVTQYVYSPVQMGLYPEDSRKPSNAVKGKCDYIIYACFGWGGLPCFYFFQFYHCFFIYIESMLWGSCIPMMVMFLCFVVLVINFLPWIPLSDIKIDTLTFDSCFPWIFFHPLLLCLLVISFIDHILLICKRKPFLANLRVSLSYTFIYLSL